MNNQTTTGGNSHRCTSPLDDDDLLHEILLRVPPRPSSLLRASLVCKRWRRLVSDPWFLRCFRAHHRKAPLLGLFEHRIVYSGDHLILADDFEFNPILEPPDRIPPQRFSLRGSLPRAGRGIELLSCRHGRLVFLYSSRGGKGFSVLVCDPVAGDQVRLPLPPEFADVVVNGTVLCAAGEQGHVHGACHSSPFKVAVMAMSRNDRRPMACLYSSETGMWGNIIIRHDGRPCRVAEFGESSTLIAHALYWKICFLSQDGEQDYMPELDINGVLEFDLDKQSLTVMKGPPANGMDRRQIIKTVDGGLGLATLSRGTLQLQVWHRNVNPDDVAAWVLFKTVDLHDILGLREHERCRCLSRRDGILGYDEDDVVIFIYVDSSFFMLQLDSMQFKRHYIGTARTHLSTCYPFRSFYTAGTATARGYDGDKTYVACMSHKLISWF